MFSGSPGSRPLTFTLPGASLSSFFVGGKPNGSPAPSSTQPAGGEMGTPGLQGRPTIASHAENILNLHPSSEAVSKGVVQSGVLSTTNQDHL